ncbi:hypothetical protein P691DRAFT_728221 [Macrolepiota fuliginosa MF-IS2]|uniref:Uncharacterized protein n=1 Tax=Macrolepiota fuliginosa MF-IS2 TaxID=1400762 RepID=A0A9P5XHD0_9AGAR|nr:hypothetical protein P691DRAFT_728221 [Macrolepiota fuliginosa MF-IS2]
MKSTFNLISILIITFLLSAAITPAVTTRHPKFRSGNAECHGCWELEPFDCPEGWNLRQHKRCYTCCKPLREY